MELTDAELEAVFDTLYGKVYYGDDEIVYGDGFTAVNLRSAPKKVDDEGKRRKIWR
jgi:hypothetical protein